jgi:DNA-binding NtrC family response regulator
VRFEEVSILIVDDDMAIRKLLAGFLGDRWHCRTASCTDEAFVLIGQRRPNVVVTDINMPGQSGLELCQLLRQKYSDVEVIVVSALSDIDHAIEALRSGAADYITKPFSLSQVTVAVERALARQRAADQNRRQAESLETRISRDTDGLGSTIEQVDSGRGQGIRRLQSDHSRFGQDTGGSRLRNARSLGSRGGL